MKKHIFILLALLLAFSVVAPVAAQDDVTTDVEIIWPKPVTEVWGAGDIVGTAAVSDMAFYFLEYLPLNDDLSFPDSAPWIPLTVAIQNTVRDGVLASLNTTEFADGLYALRLVVTTRDGQRYTDTISPIRVNNERFDAVIDRITTQALLDAGVTVTPEPTSEPTTARPDTTPRLTPSGATTNVRRCDQADNQTCPVLDFLGSGEYATILAVSNNGSGWFQIRLTSGLVGWVSPTVVTTSGDLTGLPRVAPPAPLPRPVPPAAANVVPNSVAIQNNVAVCGRTFNALVNVTNVGNLTSASGTVTLQNVNVRTGTVTFTSFGNFPTINPGGNFVVVIPVNVTVFFNEEHELRAFIGNQQATLRYVLQQGDCGIAPSPTPVPGNPGRDFAQNECFLVLDETRMVFQTPFGSSMGPMEPGTHNASRVEIVNQIVWYRVTVPNVGQAWMNGANLQTQGNCNP